MRSPRTFAASLAIGTIVTGCGARTGLDTPDASTDARVTPDAWEAPRTCIDVPREGATIAQLSLPASLQVADVMFVVDSSASMRDEIDGVRRRLREAVVPGIRRIIPDAEFGVALFGEFPVLPHALEDSGVEPYLLRSTITDDITRAEVALEDTPVWGNLDDPEASIEAVVQVATGEGLAPWIAPSFGCASGGSGGACFRPSAFHVIVLVTDAPMHNGPPGVDPVAPYAFTPAPHSYDDALRAVEAVDAIVVGLGASDALRPSPLPHLEALARDTGAVDASGAPLVFDIGGSGDRIGDDVVQAIERVAADVPLDVDAIVEDESGDDVDARALVRSIRPLSADPATGAREQTETQFLGVIPGTRLTFAIELDASALPPSTERRAYPARVVLRASSRARLDAADVLFVVPGADGLGCER